MKNKRIPQLIIGSIFFVLGAAIFIIAVWGRPNIPDWLFMSSLALVPVGAFLLGTAGNQKQKILKIQDLEEHQEFSVEFTNVKFVDFNELQDTDSLQLVCELKRNNSTFVLFAQKRSFACKLVLQVGVRYMIHNGKIIFAK